MRKKRNSVLWNVKDILSSTRVSQMTLEEEGAYRRALDIFYLNGYLPSDTTQLAKVIGKGCTVEIASKVKEMFLEDNSTVNSLTHDYLHKMPENLDEQMFVVKELDDNRKKVFQQFCNALKEDKYIMMASPSCNGLTEEQYKLVVEEFMLYKLATGQYQTYKDTNDIRRNLIYFMPYSKTIKQIKQDEQPYANPKSSTSKLATW